MRQRRLRTISESIVKHLIAGIDAAALLGAGVAAMHWDAGGVDWHLAGLVVLLGTVLALNFLHLFGAYRFDSFARIEVAVGRVLLGWLCAFGVLFLATRLFEPVNAADGPWAAAWFSAAFAAMGTTRFALWHRMRAWSRAGRLGERVAIVGAGPVAQRLLRSLAARPSDLRVVGVYDDEAENLPRACMGYPIRGTVDDLVTEAREQHIDTVIVALPLAEDRELVETLNRLCMVPVHVRLCPDAFGLRLGQVQASCLAGHTFLNVVDRPLCGWQAIAKELEDRVLGALILSLIAPLMLAIALMIKLDSPGPVLFRQKRYGFNNQLIEVFKFRSMYTHMTDADAQQLTQRNDPRITRLGAFLRRTSLDELPQFLNVVRGEMSIVGPRPHAMAAKAGSLLYQEAVKYYDARHRVKPGITGWAQVNGWRGETDTVEQIRKRVEHDLYYIEHWSILLDLKIIVRTVCGGFAGQHAF
ncbi:MAG: undecaprenyl-phosphate glucose phosphotransferase [Reyranella sp.]|uniref:undecaprenyl-phosphate glucose phosphotransferase n=1 Tax=Reyranella sp. TaxID=1929291 RepID=UPI001AD12BA1|nr:undecaprenyl-phosphate glucose phosphotransferase [Reyranella sp.]MBN9088385.1 undecaprenyl-phosphate glucose phosphotransferase [Reyranella sp.]